MKQTKKSSCARLAMGLLMARIGADRRTAEPSAIYLTII